MAGMFLRKETKFMRSVLRRRLLKQSSCLLSLLALLACFLAGQDTLVISAGTVHIGDGRILKDAFIVTEGGKITFVGKGYPVKKGMDILDFKDKVLTPGFIAAAAHMNVVDQANEEGSETTPEMNLLYSINPRAADFETAWRSGVTAVYVAPGNRNVFSGTGTVLKTRGNSPQDMLIRNQVHLKVVLGREPAAGNTPPSFNPMDLRVRRPQNRMGVVFIVRYELTKLQSKSQVPDSGLSPKELLLRSVLQGKIPLRIKARSYMDIETAFRLMDEFGYRWILEDGVDAWRYLDNLKKKNIPVIYGPVYNLRGRGDFDREDDTYYARTPLLLAEKGIPFAFKTSQLSSISRLRDEAIYAVEMGLAASRALMALTLDAAKILGVEDRLGSIEAGKDADILIFDGDPFEPSSRLNRIVMNGSLMDPHK